ncbi:MAG: glycosyltransferase family 4 protein [Rhodoluna sp.]|jgi:glycosyltransferase involved in cell wall biosynthesis
MTVSENDGLDSPRPRLLFVGKHLPVPVRGGSSQRTNLLLEALQTFADVEIAPIGHPGVRELLEDNNYCVAAVLPPDPSGLWWRLASVFFPGMVRYRARQRSAEIIRSLWKSGRYAAVVGRYLGPSARAGLHDLPLSFVDIDDLESQKVESWGNGHPLRCWLAPLASLLSKSMLKAERRVASTLSQAWVSAPEDAAKITGTRTHVVPNIPFYQAELEGASPDNGPVLFVASLDYRVNVNALNRFAAEVWPKFRARLPEARLRVVGGGLDRDSRRKLENVPGIEMAGFVDNLEEEYRRSLFSVVPIWEGGGTKIKILESLGFDRTCVVASPSLRGYGAHIIDEDALLGAKDEIEFVGAMERLFNDQALRHRLEKAGAEAVKAHFSREMLANRLRALILPVLWDKK